MAIDGLFLHVIKTRLQSLIGARIKRIHRLADYEILFEFSQKEYRNLIINLDSNTNRLFLSNTRFASVDPDRFVMLLRKTIGQGIIIDISQKELDRVLVLTIESTNEIGIRATYRLIVELMGKYANLILVDEQNIIVDSLKRITGLDESRRMIFPQVQYVFPAKPEKINPFLAREKDLDLKESLVRQLDGFSPLLSKEFLYRLEKGEPLQKILEELNTSNSLYLHGNQFHLIPLKHLESEPQIKPLFTGLEEIYQNEDNKKLKHNRKIIKSIEKEIKKLEKKIPKLEKSYQDALDYPKYRLWADLLFQNLHLEKDRTLDLYDYESETLVSVPIDMRYDLKTNANLYYKKYHKLKRARSILTEQIEKAREELDYFRLLKEQSELADTRDLEEIEQELMERHILPMKKKKGRKKTRLNYISLETDHARFWVGKNNLQNNYLTFKLAHKSDLWFHVKDYHGSHVLLRTDNPTEEEIRLAALLAAEYSNSKHSSSVPVNYTTVSQLKKVPGAKMGFVTMKNYKTIYIDPDHEKIAKLLARKPKGPR